MSSGEKGQKRISVCGRCCTVTAEKVERRATHLHDMRPLHGELFCIFITLAVQCATSVPGIAPQACRRIVGLTMALTRR